jgi:3-hydroxyisobutyrate dehydrogenase
MKITTNTRIGWIGTGIMGASMCGHLMAKGFPTTVCNRTKAKAEPLVQRGARWADSPKAVAEQSDVVFTIVGFPQDVREVYFGNQGVLAGAAAGTVVVDMTTAPPSLAVEITSAAAGKKVHAIDAPVSGGSIGARDAKLSIMVGGDAAVVADLMPLFQLMGPTIVHQGPAGAGQHTKMCNQIMIAGTMISMCESLLYAYKSGLDVTTMLKSISGGAAGCWALNNLAPRIVQRDFEPGFIIEHFIKDMGIALEESARMGIHLPGLALAHQLYTTTQTLGHGRKGTQALMLALEQLC